MRIPRHLIAELRDDACLAYANTLSWRGRAAAVETLAGFGDLLRWAAGSTGLDGKVVGGLEGWARAHPAAAAALLAEAIALRELIFRIFRAVASGEQVPDRDLVALNRVLADVPARNRLVRRESGYAWEIGPADVSPALLLAPVLWSAGDLMASDRRRRVRLCVNQECLWLFLDASKAGTRRWCDMASCGNRAKARRHYQRTRLA